MSINLTFLKNKYKKIKNNYFSKLYVLELQMNYSIAKSFFVLYNFILKQLICLIHNNVITISYLMYILNCKCNKKF